jgi:hypothetical protein
MLLIVESIIYNSMSMMLTDTQFSPYASCTFFPSNRYNYRRTKITYGSEVLPMKDASSNEAKTAWFYTIINTNLYRMRYSNTPEDTLAVP